MIKALDIEYFQSHKSTHFDFSTGVNVITGSSGVGKSAVKRNIEWNLRNSPLGGEFKSWFSGKKDVTISSIEFEEGTSTKKRENKTNSYVVNGKPCDTVKTDIPLELAALSRMEECNIQSQHEKYFLLQDSPGVVEQKLNELVGLDVIDNGFKYLNSQLLKTNQSLDGTLTDIKSKQEELLRYKDLDEIGALLNQYKILLDEINVLEIDVKDLQSAYDTKQILQKRIADKQQYVQMEVDVASIEKLLVLYKEQTLDISELQKAQTTYGILTAKIATVQPYLNMEKDVALLTSQINEYNVLYNTIIALETISKDSKQLADNIDIDQKWLTVEKYHNEVMILLSDYHTLQTDHAELIKASQTYKDKNKIIDEGTKNIRMLVDKYIQMLEQEQVCPTCGASIDSRLIQNMKKELI